MRILIPMLVLASVATTDAAPCSPPRAGPTPHRVVVLEFAGQPALARIGRSAVISALDRTEELVPLTRWNDAVATEQKTRERGARPRWQVIAKLARIDAIVDGYVQQEGQHRVLTVEVIDGASHKAVDSITIRIGDRGLTEDAEQRMETQLRELLEWIDTPIEVPQLPTVLPQSES